MDLLPGNYWQYSKNRAKRLILPYAAITLRNFLLSRSDGKCRNGCLTLELASATTVPIALKELLSLNQSLRDDLCSLGSPDKRRSRIPAATSLVFSFTPPQDFTLAAQSECFWNMP